MGAWGSGLYSGDFAMDLHGTISAISRLPFDGVRLVEILYETEPSAAYRSSKRGPHGLLVDCGRPVRQARHRESSRTRDGADHYRPGNRHRAGAETWDDSRTNFICRSLKSRCSRCDRGRCGRLVPDPVTQRCNPVQSSNAGITYSSPFVSAALGRMPNRSIRLE
jgi:hypothetical protein